MKFEIPMRRVLAALLAASIAVLSAHAGDKKDKAKTEAQQAVDSGSFGVFIKGQRVATETFRIDQVQGATDINSQTKDPSGGHSNSQMR